MADVRVHRAGGRVTIDPHPRLSPGVPDEQADPERLGSADGRIDPDFEDRIDPALRQGLTVFERLGHSSGDFSGTALQKMRRTMQRVLDELADPDELREVVVQDRVIDGIDGHRIPVRTYAPEGHVPSGSAGLLWIHGGGMVMGNVAMDDGGCAEFARELGCVVASVEYRLAPEHPHPAPVSDCHDALVWLADGAGDLGVDPGRIAIAGGSAGGGLAAATCLRNRDLDGPEVAFQALLYPMLDDRNIQPSTCEFGDIPSWSRHHNLAGWAALLGDAAGGSEVSPHAAPARATDLAGLPPAFIQVGEADLFRDEDIDYAVRLLRDGVPTELHVYPGVYHGAEGFCPDAPVARRMADDLRGALSRALA